MVLGRSLLICVVVVLGLLVVAETAKAHAGRGGASDYRSSVTAVPAEDGLTARVTNQGEYWIELRTPGDAEVVVAGYAGEPLIRLGPGGAFENSRSPSLDATWGPDGTVIVDAAPGGSPEWRRIGDGRSVVWHDHRIHWGADFDPPGVAAERGARQRVSGWAIPVSIDGRPARLAGEVIYEPPPAAWPWLVAIVALGAALGAVALRGPSLLARAVSRGAAIAAIAAGLALAVAEPLMVPRSALASTADTGDMPAFVQAGLWIGLTGAALTLWLKVRNNADREATLLIGATWLIAGIAALGRLDYFANAVIPEPYPPAIARGLVAVALIAALPTAAWAWRRISAVRRTGLASSPESRGQEPEPIGA